MREVRVIGENGEQLGILPTREALALAMERNLDLVEVAPTAKPPVCRLMDYGKFRYEQSKRERETRKRQKTITVKELRITAKIDDHDLDVKARNAERFLRDGDKVKVTVRFRGREIVHKDLAINRLEDLPRRLAPFSSIERPPRMEGRSMVMILAPKAEN